MSDKLLNLALKYPAPFSTRSMECCKHHTIDVSKLKTEDMNSLDDSERKTVMKWVYELFVPVPISEFYEAGFVEEDGKLVRHPQ